MKLRSEPLPRAGGAQPGPEAPGTEPTCGAPPPPPPPARPSGRAPRAGLEPGPSGSPSHAASQQTPTGTFVKSPLLFRFAFKLLCGELKVHKGLVVFTELFPFIK